MFGKTHLPYHAPSEDQDGMAFAEHASAWLTLPGLLGHHRHRLACAGTPLVLETSASCYILALAPANPQHGPSYQYKASK